MKIASNFVCFIILSGVASACIAADDFDRTVDRLGVQVPATGYFYINEAWSQQCANGVMYLDMSTSAGRAQFAAVLATKKAGGILRWVNYTKDANNICNASLIEIR